MSSSRAFDNPPPRMINDEENETMRKKKKDREGILPVRKSSALAKPKARSPLQRRYNPQCRTSGVTFPEGRIARDA